MESDKGKDRVDRESTSAPIKDEPTPTVADELRITIEKKLLSHSPLLPPCCIFKVPEVIRRQKTEAYEPNIVSIGPFHHRRDKKFQFFEDVKRWYLHRLLDSSTDVSLESLIKVIMELGKSARDCYAPDPSLDGLCQKDFVEMMILDGGFLLELFRKTVFYDPQEENDPVFNVPCMQEHLYHDLLLLENQLPWSVLECLYNLTANSRNEFSLTSLVLSFFRQSMTDDLLLNHSFKLPFKILHILDLIRKAMVTGFEEKSDEGVKNQQKKNELKLPRRIPNATSLSEAGVQFNKSQNKGEGVCILNIEFKNGVFTIPQLGIDERTEPLFRNLIAFEQCHDRCQHKITSYAVLMDNLIDSREDVNFLCHKGILANWLNPDDAAKFFNKLYNDTTVIDYYYRDLSVNVNTHYESRCPKFMAILRRDYFSTPWRTISVIAAFILLVLTLVQTIYTIQWP